MDSDSLYAPNLSPRPGGTANADDDKKAVANSIERWSGILNKTEVWRDQQAERKGWKRALAEFEGDWSHYQQSISIPIVPLNLVFAYVKTEISRLYFKDPYMTVNAKRVEDLGSAQIAEQLLNYTWSELDLKRQVKLALTDALIVGHGWVKSGYVAEIGTKEETVESKDAPKRGPGRPPKKDNKPDLNTSEYVKSESAFATHIPWNHVIFEPSSSWPAPDHARWMACKVVKPLSVVKTCGLYKGVDDLKGTNLDDEDKKNHQDGSWVVVWEIWDRETRQVYTMAEGHKKWLKDPMPWPYQHDGYPFSMLSFNPVPGNPYPVSDVLMQEPQIVQMMKMMAIMENHMKRWNRQLIAKRGLFSPDEMNKFKQGIDGAIIEAEGNVQTDLNPSPYAPVQQDVYGIWNLVADILRNVSGQSETERGAPPKSGTRTLGELRLALQGSRSRADEKMDIVEMFIEDIAKKLLSIMQQKYTLPKIVRIVGPKKMEKVMMVNRPSAQGQNQSTSYTQMSGDKVQSFTTTKDDIHGEMDVDVIAGSTIPLDKENQLQIMEKLVPNLELIGITPGSRAALAYAREYMRLINVTSLSQIVDIAEEEAQNPKPDPEQQKMQMEMQAQQQDSQLKGQQHQLKMQGQQQKTQLQLASLAAKTQSQQKLAQVNTQSAMELAQIDAQKAKASLQMDIMKNILAMHREKSGASNGNSQKE